MLRISCLHKKKEQGYSLVELLVALLFTMILMAGMATVFKTSLSSFVTSGEKLSNARRNRMALDMLSDDLNISGQYLTQLDQYPSWVLTSNPGFWIEPGADASIPDQLHLAFNEALPFDAALSLPAGETTTTSNAAAVMARTTLQDYPSSFTLTTRSDQASLVKSGMYLVFKDSFDVKQIQTAEDNADGTISISTMASITDDTGASTGASGNYFNVPHKDKAPVLVVMPPQQVRYSVKNKNLDPENVGLAVPCLIREQCDYGKIFASTESSYTSSLIAENVTNLKIWLSVDNGTTWITGTSWANIQAKVNTALEGAGRQGYTSITSNPHWYRDIPALVRIDLTTQTAKSREEYSDSLGKVARKTQTQTLIMLPRYFGLSYYQ